MCATTAANWSSREKSSTENSYPIVHNNKKEKETEEKETEADISVVISVVNFEF